MTAPHPSGALPSWADQAACMGMDVNLWFALGGDDQDEALAICRLCPVRLDCLEYAIATGQQDGIWGGLTQDQLAPLRRQRREGRT